MATTGTPTEDAGPADLASALEDADLVRIASRADGDGLAAIAILGNALAERGIPRHLALSPTRAAAESRFEDDEGVVTVSVEAIEKASQTESLALCAYELARSLDGDPDPGLAVAGATAARVPADGKALADAKAAGLTERPGLAIPTADVVDGLAYSGWLHAPFSGDEAAVTSFLDDLEVRPVEDDTARQELASAVALKVTEEIAHDRTTDALEMALGVRSSPTAFETVGGYADVLRAAAAIDPGAGLAALLGAVDEATLLDLWRAYGATVHDAVTDLAPSSESVVTGTVTGIPPDDVARLGHDFRFDADRVYVEGDESVALATSDEATEILQRDFPEEEIANTPTLATVRTTAGLDGIDRSEEGQT